MFKRMGPQDSGQARPTDAPELHAAHNLDGVPAALLDVALIDGPTCAAAGAISISTWHELVRTGAAPQPVMRAVRCTRWRLADVRAWLIERAARATPDDDVIRRATKASAKARAPEAVEKARATRRANIEAVEKARPPRESRSQRRGDPPSEGQREGANIESRTAAQAGG